jgi:hypothetical protein
MSITEERQAEIDAFTNTDFSDCPVLTQEQMEQFVPSHYRPQSGVSTELSDFSELDDEQLAQLNPSRARVIA